MMTRIFGAVAIVTMTAAAANAQAVSQTTCTRYGDTSACTSTYTPAARTAPPVEPYRPGPGSREDVFWYKASAELPAKPFDNLCGPGFKMLRDFSCALTGR